MTAPRTYAEWSVLLDELKNGTNDAEVLDAMKGGTLAWQSGVAERFAKKLTDAVNTRMNRASDRFSREKNRFRRERAPSNSLRIPRFLL